MPAFLDFIPAVVWRWLAITGVAAAFGLFCYTKGEDAIQSEWDHLEQVRKDQALELAAAQARGMAHATEDHAERVRHDAQVADAVRAAVRAQCGVLPARPQVPGADARRPAVPALPRRGAEGAAPAQDPELGEAIAEDVAVTCPALYDQAKWLRDLAIAAGADKD